MPAIVTKSLTKNYSSLIAVNSVDLTVEDGELFGLLGPNGAGKTTTLKMLSTLLQPTSGEAFVNNFNVRTQPNEVRKAIGMVFQDPSLDDDLTAFENLELHASLYGMPKDLAGKRIHEVLNLVDLLDKKDLIVKTFSGGMKRRLEIARGLVHHPRVLFLDEPTLGLDPQTRRHIWEYIKKLNESEKLAVILTTHYMDEADKLCNRVAIIDLGKIVSLDTPQNLKKLVGKTLVKVNSSDNPKLAELKIKGIESAKIVEGKVVFSIDDGSKVVPEIVLLAQNHKISINSVEIVEASLEDVFIHLTGKSIREEVLDAKDAVRESFRAKRRVFNR